MNKLKQAEKIIAELVLTRDAGIDVSYVDGSVECIYCDGVHYYEDAVHAESCPVRRGRAWLKENGSLSEYSYWRQSEAKRLETASA